MRFATAYAPLGLTLIALIAGAWFMHARLDSGVIPPVLPHATIPAMSTTLSLASPAFADGASILASFTCDDTHPSNPPLIISEVPADAKSLALIVDDPDVPKTLMQSGVFDHWILFDIPTSTESISSGSSAGIAGNNSAGKSGYYPPCPPKEYEPSEHRYVFTLYALDTTLGLPEGTDKTTLLAAMEGHIISKASLTGRYRRK